MREYKPWQGEPEKENIFHGENQIVDNFFTQSEIIKIMSDSLDTRNVEYKERLSQRNHIIYLDGELRDKVTKKAEELSGTTGLNLVGSSYAVYQNIRTTTAPVRRPRLQEHYDTNMGGPMVTIDVQMASNIDWPLLVDGKEYTLKDGQALLFSGTNQLHGRPEIIFKDEDYIHLLFLHFGLNDPEQGPVRKQNMGNYMEGGDSH
jgi:hypothetical protein